MNRHRFAVSRIPGVERCACGTERELAEDVTPPYRSFWWYRLTEPVALFALGYPRDSRVEGMDGWDCPARRSA